MLVCDRFSRRACHTTSRTLLCLTRLGLVEQGGQGGRWPTLQRQSRSHLGGQFHLLAKEKSGIPTLTVWQSEAEDDEQSDNTMVTHQCTCKYKPLTSIAVILESEFNLCADGIPDDISDECARSSRSDLPASSPQDDLLQVQSEVRQLTKVTCWW